MSRGRKYNIEQAKRKKAEAAKVFKENGWKASDRALGIHANTPTPCSCGMCGNPRKYYGNSKHGQTLPERTTANEVKGVKVTAVYIDEMSE